LLSSVALLKFSISIIGFERYFNATACSSPTFEYLLKLYDGFCPVIGPLLLTPSSRTDLFIFLAVRCFCLRCVPLYTERGSVKNCPRAGLLLRWWCCKFNKIHFR